jgi:3-mercaptopyruvate sulfurtransferase SseA
MCATARCRGELAKGERMKALQAGVIALLAAVPAAGSADVSVVGAADVHATLVSNPKALVVDARTSAEYEQAHIPGAINIPAAETRTSAARLPRGLATPLIFYCRGPG